MTAKKTSLYRAEHIEEKKCKRHSLWANEYMEQKALENVTEVNDLRHEIEGVFQNQLTLRDTNERVVGICGIA